MLVAPATWALPKAQTRTEHFHLETLGSGGQLDLLSADPHSAHPLSHVPLSIQEKEQFAARCDRQDTKQGQRVVCTTDKKQNNGEEFSACKLLHCHTGRCENLQRQAELEQEQREVDQEIHEEQQRVERIDADMKRLNDEMNALKNKLLSSEKNAPPVG
jgi:uncharacterized coiled-coil protein SlyX